ncbi:strictosidine synthase [Rothia nasisuis]|uniref:strictosidine synthase n=1 Tax=Rothia nasisuis TaxID=2109647 RepID=UPI001F3E7FBE|nr:strictosidine synthase [Rothia nasisuis]
MAPNPIFTKEFSSSILLWIRHGMTVPEGKDYWAGGHAQIIAASKGLKEYRQLHISEAEHSFWPAHPGLETVVRADRRINGIADVTFQSTLAATAGREQTALAFKDEINVFRRTLMYIGLPGSTRWYTTPVARSQTQLRDVVFFRRAQGARGREFKDFMHNRLAPSVLAQAGISELRTETFLPWHKKTWDTPNVAHDNPKADRYHGLMVIGFESETARAAFYEQVAPHLNSTVDGAVSAIHSFAIEDTKVFVEGGRRLPA